jgi:hypothetical protein
MRDVLHWVYERYVLRRPAAARPHLTPALAVRERSASEYTT